MGLLIHENLGGGFSPPAANKIRRLGRKARSGIGRAPYKTDRKISFVSYHTRSISMNITRAEARWQLHKAVNTAKGNLCRHRDRNPTGGAYKAPPTPWSTAAGQGRNERTRGVSRSVVVGTTLLTCCGPGPAPREGRCLGTTLHTGERTPRRSPS